MKRQITDDDRTKDYLSKLEAAKFPDIPNPGDVDFSKMSFEEGITWCKDQGKKVAGTIRSLNSLIGALTRISKDDYSELTRKFEEHEMAAKEKVGELIKKCVLVGMEIESEQLATDEEKREYYLNMADFLSPLMMGGDGFSFNQEQKILTRVLREKAEQFNFSKLTNKGLTAREKMILLGYLGFFDAPPFGEEEGLGKQRRALSKILGVSDTEIRKHYDSNNHRFWESDKIPVSNHLELFEYLRDEWGVGPLA